MILAGDIGGTKTNLAYFKSDHGKLTLLKTLGYPSREFASLDDVVRKFRDSFPADVECAAFGVPGPVVRGRTETTNLKWVVDSAPLADLLKLDHVGLLNDLQATAYGVLHLEARDKLVLNEGVPAHEGSMAVIAAGTGLGESGLIWDGREYKAVASEGGHSDFAPRDDVEDQLLIFLRGEFGRVSYERVVSGPGLRNLYRFFRTRVNYPEPEWLAKAIADGDPSAAVAQAAQGGKDEAASLALERFVSLYGAEAGNLALKILATGGVYVGGGIAPKVVAELQEGSFMTSFKAKGRYSPLLARMPVCVMLNDRIALSGAAHFALMNRDGNH